VNYSALLRSALVALLRNKMRSVLTVLGITIGIAALVAVDAPAASYAFNIEAAAEIGLTIDDAEDILVAVAPIVGTARIVSATTNLAEGLGLAIALADDEDG